jgi:hypothetical protein
MEPKVNNLLLPQPLTSLQSEPRLPSDYPNPQDADRAAFKSRLTAAQLKKSVENATSEPRSAKSVPLAEVLNSNSPKTGPAARLAASQDDDPKKRRKLDDEQETPGTAFAPRASSAAQPTRADSNIPVREPRRVDAQHIRHLIAPP